MRTTDQQGIGWQGGSSRAGREGGARIMRSVLPSPLPTSSAPRPPERPLPPVKPARICAPPASMAARSRGRCLAPFPLPQRPKWALGRGARAAGPSTPPIRACGRRRFCIGARAAHASALFSFLPCAPLLSPLPSSFVMLPAQKHTQHNMPSRHLLALPPPPLVMPPFPARHTPYRMPPSPSTPFRAALRSLHPEPPPPIQGASLLGGCRPPARGAETGRTLIRISLPPTPPPLLTWPSLPPARKPGRGLRACVPNNAKVCGALLSPCPLLFVLLVFLLLFPSHEMTHQRAPPPSPHMLPGPPSSPGPPHTVARRPQPSIYQPPHRAGSALRVPPARAPCTIPTPRKRRALAERPSHRACAPAISPPPPRPAPPGPRTPRRHAPRLQTFSQSVPPSRSLVD